MYKLILNYIQKAFSYASNVNEQKMHLFLQVSHSVTKYPVASWSTGIFETLTSFSWNEVP